MEILLQDAVDGPVAEILGEKGPFIVVFVPLAPALGPQARARQPHIVFLVLGDAPERDPPVAVKDQRRREVGGVGIPRHEPARGGGRPRSRDQRGAGHVADVEVAGRADHIQLQVEHDLRRLDRHQVGLQIDVEAHFRTPAVIGEIAGQAGGIAADIEGAGIVVAVAQHLCRRGGACQRQAQAQGSTGESKHADLQNIFRHDRHVTIPPPVSATPILTKGKSTATAVYPATGHPPNGYSVSI